MNTQQVQTNGNGNGTTTQHAPASAIDLDEYVADATAAFQQAVAANKDTQGLRPEHRAALLNEIARALRLNPLTKPVIFLKTQQGEAIYVTRQGADQIAARLRLNRETIAGPEVRDIGGVKIAFCQVRVTTPDGRSEMATATLPFVDPANVLMKVETKCKRRATLSIAGLGMLSEEDAEGIPVDDVFDRDAGSQEPTAAQASLELDLNECALPSHALAAWLKHRDALTKDGDRVREDSFDVVVKRVSNLAEISKTAARKFLTAGIAEHNAELAATIARAEVAAKQIDTNTTTEPTVSASTEAPAVAPEPTTAPSEVIPAWEDYTAQMTRCETGAAVADLVVSAAADLHAAKRRRDGWALAIEHAATLGVDEPTLKRMVEERGPPDGPKGGRARRDATPPPAAIGSGADASTGDAPAARAEVTTVLDAEETERRLIEHADAWREHCAAANIFAIAGGYHKRLAAFDAAGVRAARWTVADELITAKGGSPGFLDRYPTMVRRSGTVLTMPARAANDATARAKATG